MIATTATTATIGELETAILLDVVTRFVNLRERTSRLSLLINRCVNSGSTGQRLCTRCVAKEDSME